MIIVGAKGLAKELLEIVYLKNWKPNDLYFFDNVSKDLPDKLYDNYDIIMTIEECKSLFKTHLFCLGVGNPKVRYKLYKLMKSNGGEPGNVIADSADIGSFGTTIGTACTIMNNVIITNDVTIGDGCLININACIGHDSKIGNFVEICPSVNISGHVTVGDFCTLGTGCIILPNVTIGNNCSIGAGCVVHQDVPDNSIVSCLPGRIVKNNPPFPES